MTGINNFFFVFSTTKLAILVNSNSLVWKNRQLHYLGFCNFCSASHTQQPIFSVHGMEYGFGAHDFPVSGVFEVEPKSCPGFIFRCSIPLGRVKMPPSEFRTFIESMASEYHGDTYHLITKNCNHFTDDIACRMTGKHIPGWVNRLAWFGMLCFPTIKIFCSCTFVFQSFVLKICCQTLS